jgi:hypothetical protein
VITIPVSPLVLLKLITPYDGYKAGTVVWIDAPRVDWLIENGVAERWEETEQ